MPGEPSVWAVSESRHLYLYGRCACDLAGTCALHLDIAEAIAAAELRGHTRAVNETAIASIHKAVAAERAAVVAWLRLDSEESTNDTVAYTAARLADEIERGDHHFPKEQA